MRIAALILGYEDVEYLPRAARSVEDDVGSVYIVDNGSSAAVVEALERLCAERGYVFIPTGENLGYGKGNNVGIERALGDGCDAVLIMNNDAFAHAGAVDGLAAYLREHDRVAAAGPLVLWHPSGRVMHTASVLDESTGRIEWLDQNVPLEAADLRPRPTGYLSGEAFLVRAAVLEQVGGFDPRFENYFEDAEWSVRVRRAGWELHVVPSAVFDHVWGGTMPGMAGAFHRARSRPLFLSWALGKPWWSAALLSVRPTAYAAALHAGRGHPWQALRGVLFGWLSGVGRLLRERLGRARGNRGTGA